MLVAKIRLISAQLILVIFFICLLSCQGNSGASQIELRIAWWGTQRLHERTIKAIELYQKLNPKISIKYEYYGWREYWSRLGEYAGQSELPDIIQHDYTLLADWVKRGLLISLDELVKSRHINLKAIPQAAINVGKVDDKLYAINLGNTAMAWLIDEEAFQQAGIPLPSPLWTWEDFEQLSIELATKLGKYGFATRLYNYQICRSYLLGHKEWWYTADGKSLNYSDENFINYLQMLIRLQNAHAIVTRDMELTDFNEDRGLESNPLITQQAAMSYMWSNHIMAFSADLEKKGRKLKLQPIPRPKGGQAADYIKPTMFFAVTRDSKNSKEAAKFINWFTNSIDANKLLLAERGIPVSQKVQLALKPYLSPLQAQVFDFVSSIAINGTPTPPADPEVNVAIRDNIYYLEVVDPVMYNKLAPAAAAAIFRLMATEVLSKN
jgi:multiple sugar transport system substrate-binding protein